MNWWGCNPAKFKVVQWNKRKNWCAGRALIRRKHASLDPLFGSLIQFPVVLQTGSMWCNPHEVMIIWNTYQWSTTSGARLKATASASSAKRSRSSDFRGRLGGVMHDIVRAVGHYTLHFWHASLMNTAALNDTRILRHCLYCQYNSHNWLILHPQCCARIALYSWLSRYWVCYSLLGNWLVSACFCQLICCYVHIPMHKAGFPASSSLCERFGNSSTPVLQTSVSIWIICGFYIDVPEFGVEAVQTTHFNICANWRIDHVHRYGICSHYNHPAI